MTFGKISQPSDTPPEGEKLSKIPITSTAKDAIVLDTRDEIVAAMQQNPIDENAKDQISMLTFDLRMISDQLRTPETLELHDLTRILDEYEVWARQYAQLPIELRAGRRPKFLSFAADFEELLHVHPKNLQERKLVIARDIAKKMQMMNDGLNLQYGTLMLFQKLDVGYDAEKIKMEQLRQDPKTPHNMVDRYAHSFQNSRLLLSQEMIRRNDWYEIYQELLGYRVDYLSGGDFSIRMSPTSFLGFAESGRLKNWNDFNNEVESGSSSSHGRIRSTPGERKTAEQGLGFDDQHGRVAYGVYEFPRRADLQHHFKDFYGAVEVRFSIHDLGNNISVTLGDSLGLHYQPQCQFLNEMHREIEEEKAKKLQKIGIFHYEHNQNRTYQSIFVPEHADIAFMAMEREIRESSGGHRYVEMQSPISEVTSDKIKQVTLAVSEDDYASGRADQQIAEIRDACAAHGLFFRFEIVPHL